MVHGHLDRWRLGVHSLLIMIITNESSRLLWCVRCDVVYSRLGGVHGTLYVRDDPHRVFKLLVHHTTPTTTKYIQFYPQIEPTHLLKTTHCNRLHYLNVSLLICINSSQRFLVNLQFHQGESMLNIRVC